MREELLSEPRSRVDAGEKPLRRDVRMLGFELGQVLRRHGRDGLFELVEEVRTLAKRRRQGEADAERSLRDRIAGLGPDTLDELIRALACFFDLSNLAEDRHRIRVLRQRERELHPAPKPESIGRAIQTLREEGATAEDVQRLLDRLVIDLVFTAHPTEAKRRTVRNALRRLRDDLVGIDRGHLLPRERDWIVSRIKTDLEVLWETDSLRPRRPTVLEEVTRSLFVADSLWRVMPWLLAGMRQALAVAYPGETFEVPAFIRFGSWIGGDRDGNPFVTPEVTRATLARLREVALDNHLSQCRLLTEVSSLSTRRTPVSPELSQALDAAVARWPEVAEAVERLSPAERYRHWLAVIRHRLTQTRTADPFEPLPDAAYGRASGLSDDLAVMERSLRAGRHDHLADGRLRQWQDLVTVFGFHFARLDIREDARVLQASVAELWPLFGGEGNYAAMSEKDKCAVLVRPPTRDVTIDHESLTEPTRKTLGLFTLLHRVRRTFGPEALGVAIVSMTHEASDVLSVLWLSHAGAAVAGDDEPASPLPLVPLFETISDLERADAILEAMFAEDAYRRHVADNGGEQVCMVGYSDSTKDGGYLAANWNLYRGEERLAQLTRRLGVGLTVFHGRGGALGRGGGPAARGILSLPPDSVDGRIRITEQGEVLAERYDDPEVAHRHLEQVTWATLLVSKRKGRNPPAMWRDAMQRAADAAFKAYRGLIEDPGFVDYFASATPIDSIESLQIGSRPARRRAGDKPRDLSCLRAIPYTFAWTQSRHLLTAFFGLGSGLIVAAGGGDGGDDEREDWSVFREMYAEWPFFRAVIDNAELALAKCDTAIAGAYAALVVDRDAGDHIYTKFRDEYARSRHAILQVTGQEELLAGVPWLQRSITVRNPYVDALNLIQVELMRRLRAPGAADAERETLAELLRLSIQGVAAGLRTTG